MSSFFALPSSWSLSYLITGSATGHLLCYGADHAREECQDLANPLPVRVALRASREWCSKSPGKRSARADYGKKFDMTTFPEGYLCVHPTQSKDSKGWSRACNIWRGEVSLRALSLIFSRSIRAESHQLKICAMESPRPWERTGSKAQCYE